VQAGSVTRSKHLPHQFMLSRNYLKKLEKAVSSKKTKDAHGASKSKGGAASKKKVPSKKPKSTKRVTQKSKKKQAAVVSKKPKEKKVP